MGATNIFPLKTPDFIKLSAPLAVSGFARSGLTTKTADVSKSEDFPRQAFNILLIDKGGAGGKNLTRNRCQ
jgi:hypothetical protein